MLTKVIRDGAECWEKWHLQSAPDTTLVNVPILKYGFKLHFIKVFCNSSKSARHLRLYNSGIKHEKLTTVCAFRHYDYFSSNCHLDNNSLIFIVY